MSGKIVFCPPNQPITFKDGKTYTKKAAIAKHFNKKISSIGNHAHFRHTQKVIRSIKKKKMDPEFKPISDEDTISAIKRAKASTAVGQMG